MPVSAAQKKASIKYLEKLDEVRIRMEKGKKDNIKAAATTAGESMNQYIINAIEQRVERDSTQQGAAGGLQEAGVVSLPSDALKAAQEAAQAAGEALPVFVARAVETQKERDALGRKMKGGQ